jgi:hypothetical protein
MSPKRQNTTFEKAILRSDPFPSGKQECRSVTLKHWKSTKDLLADFANVT